MIDQRISFVTIGVQNLEKMKTWYREVFGWVPMKDNQGICFYRMNGCIFGLYPASDLAQDVGIDQDGSGFKRFTLAINVRSEAEVDSVVNDFRGKGVRIVRYPESISWGGYRGYVADPEDNYWEIVYNPFITLDSTGNVLAHT